MIKASEKDIDKTENTSQCSYTKEEFKKFVDKFEWVFAKTYANSAPHEYIVLNKVGVEHKDKFVKIAKFIREKGFKAFYYSRSGYYFIIDDYYYWTMDENVNDTDLINRAKLDDYELIDGSWHWKNKMKTY